MQNIIMKLNCIMLHVWYNRIIIEIGTRILKTLIFLNTKLTDVYIEKEQLSIFSIISLYNLQINSLCILLKQKLLKLQSILFFVEKIKKFFKGNHVFMYTVHWRVVIFKLTNLTLI